MKKAVTVILTLALVLCSASVCLADVDYSQWDSAGTYPSDVINTKLFTPVKHLVDKKIVEGYEDGLFHADYNVTRAEFTKMMLIASHNANDLRIYANENTFTDTTKHWAHDYIELATALRIINGMGDGTFAPDGNVSYVQAVAIFCRATDASVGVEYSWPNNYINYATQFNLYGNTQNVQTWTKADWNKPATREDIAWLIYRNMKH